MAIVVALMAHIAYNTGGIMADREHGPLDGIESATYRVSRSWQNVHLTPHSWKGPACRTLRHTL